MKKMNNKGFSLVELIIVIAIMAVLMGVLAPQLLKYVESSRLQSDLTAMSEVENAVKIALSVEKIYNAVGTGTTVEIADGAQVDSPIAELKDELLKTIPDEIELTSKAAEANAPYTLTITFDASQGTFTMTKDTNWQALIDG